MSNMKKIYYIESGKTGGHYAFKTDKSKKPFENPLSTYNKFNLKPDDVVADLGAYVGEYALSALKQGVKLVKSYEPTPETFYVLMKNKRENMEIYNYAVVGNEEKNVYLNISLGIGVTNSISKGHKKGGKIVVNAIRYEDAIKGCNVVKIDVEGAEYDYDIIQPQLRGIILEFHPRTDFDWKEKAYKIMDNIEKSGYKCIHRPEFKNGWDLTGCWEKI